MKASITGGQQEPPEEDQNTITEPIRDTKNLKEIINDKKAKDTTKGFYLVPEHSRFSACITHSAQHSHCTVSSYRKCPNIKAKAIQDNSITEISSSTFVLTKRTELCGVGSTGEFANLSVCATGPYSLRQ